MASGFDGQIGIEPANSWGTCHQQVVLNDSPANSCWTFQDDKDYPTNPYGWIKVSLEFVEMMTEQTYP